MKSFLSIALVLTWITAAVAGPKPQVYKVDPAQSKVEWTATKLTGKHNGTVGIKSGSLEFSGDKLTAGKFELDMTTITVSDLQGEWGQKLTGHLKNDDFFSVEKYNTSTLVIKKADLKSSNLYKITADLTIKGITKEIQFDANVQPAAGTATAEIKVDRVNYDIKYRSGKFFPEIGDKLIHDEFTLQVALAFGKAM
jgi:polyisoprenoid-binding protein YceI